MEGQQASQSHVAPQVGIAATMEARYRPYEPDLNEK